MRKSMLAALLVIFSGMLMCSSENPHKEEIHTWTEALMSEDDPTFFNAAVTMIKSYHGDLPDNLDSLYQLCVNRRIEFLIHHLSVDLAPSNFDRFTTEIKLLGGTLPPYVDSLRQQCIDRRVTEILTELSTMEYVARESQPHNWMQMTVNGGKPHYLYIAYFDNLIEDIKQLKGEVSDNVMELRKNAIDRRIKTLQGRLSATTSVLYFDSCTNELKELGGRLPSNLDSLRRECDKRSHG
ncbi:MAG: hypothetical protein WC289_04090 [Patescibacteria group bacterium]|jgi:flagellin-specific chaperone FliS